MGMCWRGNSHYVSHEVGYIGWPYNMCKRYATLKVESHIVKCHSDPTFRDKHNVNIQFISLIRKDALLDLSRQMKTKQKNTRLQISAHNISIKLRHLEDQRNAGKYRRPRLRYNIVQTGATARTCEDLHIFCQNFSRKVDSRSSKHSRTISIDFKSQHFSLSTRL